MPYNPLWGVGREPRVAGTPSTTSINDNSLDLNAGASPPSQTLSAVIQGGIRVLSFAISIIPQQRDQTSTNARLVILLNNNLIASYQLPASQAAAGPVLWYINEIIPYDYTVAGQEVPFTVTISADNGGTTGYIMEVRIAAIGIEI